MTRAQVSEHYRMLRGLIDAARTLAGRPCSEPEESAVLELIQDDLDSVALLLVDAEAHALESMQ